VDWSEALFQVINLRSFSSLWYWIVVAVTWSSISHYVMGVPYDLITRARRNGGDDLSDLNDLVRINVNRLLHISHNAGMILTAFVFFALTTLCALGFYYRIELAQAVFLLALPLSVVGLVTHDKRLAAMQAALAFFAPDMPVVVFPAWDCLPYDRSSPNVDVSAARMATLAALVHGMPKQFVLLTTLNAATQKVPARQVLREAAFTAQVGKRIDENALRAFLIRMGFTQSPTVMEPGDFAVRGGIIDIFPPGQSGPVRLDLFGDVLDGARRFDPATQRTTETLKDVELAPVSEVILDEAAITRFRQNYRIEFGAAGTDDPLYEAVSAGRKHAGIEHWLGFFDDNLETLFDYLGDMPVVLDDQTTPARIARWDSIADQYGTRMHALSQKGRMDSVYKPAPPALLYLDDAAWDAAVADRRILALSPNKQATGVGVIDAGARSGRNFAPERQQENISLFASLAAHIKVKLDDGPVVIASYSEGARERLSGLIEDEGLGVAVPITDFSRVGKTGLHLAVWALDAGFEAPNLTVISEQDVLGDRLIRQTKRKRRAENFLTEANSLAPGDLVVHVDHGVGRFTGMEVVTALGAAHECLLLEYAEQSKLYLPVENIELLSKYGHETGLLDKLGGGAWQAKKARLKERIRQIAERLIRVAAERALRTAPALDPPEGLWDQFLARFPYCRHPCLVGQRGEVQKPWPACDRRRTKVRRATQRTAETIAHRCARSHINCDAYPTDITAFFVRRA